MSEPERRDGASETLQAADLPAPVVRASQLCLDRNAREGVVLDLRGLSNATDYFLIASGDSDTHVKAISEHVLEEMTRAGIRAAGVEGLRAGRWVLIDYIDFVVHIFHPVLREFYQLEQLWGDAPMMAMEESAP